jgi:hypothetical protein
MIGADPLALNLADPSTFGLIPRALLDILDRAAAAAASEATSQVAVRLSILEVYNDRLRDLLRPTRDEQPLRIREDPSSGPYAVGLDRVSVDLAEPKASRDDSVLQLLSVASAIRVTADTSAGSAHGGGGGRFGGRGGFDGGHEASSRGHAVLNVDLEVRGVTTRAQLVDLAGSERGATQDPQRPGSAGSVAGKRGRIEGRYAAEVSPKVQSQRHRERIEIGRSLANLNVIINGLAKGDDPATLPFRQCKMTWLLKQARGCPMRDDVAPQNRQGDGQCAMTWLLKTGKGMANAR